MPRIAGVDIPDRKKILFSLQYVHGIGPKVAADILSRTGVDPDRRANELTDDEVTNIASLIDDELVVEGALRRQVAQSIQRLRDINCWRGDRHKKGLPVRGQSSKTNARTRKGKKKTVAGKKAVGK
ncbi:MAG: 30S ribosomal protein S13 [Planctomycetota bacterium]|mgnify:FL=1|jgi:small subunit ribosomal protein S13|nr:30S ribosomal protein S13 [Phycisphaerae bacterium]MEC7128807.1 30S ribosomal protein S13 [Planctomycetota bacterium]MBL21404.1 30S ribosomal protein S13 [Phycisphaerae bacterium]MEC7195549.1 30S ribosomal protein S13 [Planctomycetota bacterium]MEC7385445.1 30S ribosomal protein S13 [Planctomycetota bacterium]|tara:strand:- start:18 stop:395 length:378 start_codon:yes stop_codon:yes gene_type:complete